MFPVEPLYYVQSSLCTEISFRIIPVCFVSFIYKWGLNYFMMLKRISSSYGGRLDALSSPPQPATNILIILAGNRLDFFYCTSVHLSVRRTGHVARMGERRGVYTGFWWGNLREIDHLEDPGVDGRIILRCIFRKWDVEAGTRSIWLRIGTGGGCL